MNEDDEENEGPLLFQLIGLIFKIVFVILFIVFTILTLGIFLTDEPKEEKEKTRKISNYEEKLRINLQRKKNRLISVSIRIKDLEPMIGKIKKSERQILFTSRLLIALLIISANVYFLHINKMLDSNISNFFMQFKNPDCIGNIVNFNGLILILYGIPAYISMELQVV